jgi:hypothetical protein
MMKREEGRKLIMRSECFLLLMELLTWKDSHYPSQSIRRKDERKHLFLPSILLHSKVRTLCIKAQTPIFHEEHLSLKQKTLLKSEAMN